MRRASCTGRTAPAATAKASISCARKAEPSTSPADAGDRAARGSWTCKGSCSAARSRQAWRFAPVPARSSLRRSRARRRPTTTPSSTRSPRPSPLIFMVPGTGAGPNSIKSEYLQRALFQGGYHVISLASPAEPEFIVTASSTGITGHPQDDARDLYRVMKLAYEKVKDRIQVEKFHLLGYSLGAWHAAFVANLDAQEKKNGFDRVLLINPPVSLYTSAQILDNMLDENIPGGSGNIGVLLGRLVNQFATFYQQAGEQLDFSSEYILYNLYTRMQPSDEELEALIGLAFRFTSANLAFTSDVMTNAGLIVPKNLELGPASSLTEYFEVSIRMTFIDYFNDLYYPYFKNKDPTITKQDLIDQASLETIHDFLASADHVGLMTNEDDIILAPGQIEYLRELFGDRAQIWPTGGHMGNLGTRAVTAYVVDYFGR